MSKGFIGSACWGQTGNFSMDDHKGCQIVEEGDPDLGNFGAKGYLTPKLGGMC